MVEPLADDHSSDNDDAPTGVEAPAAPAGCRCSKESSHESAGEAASNPYHIREHTTIMTALCLCVVRKMSSASPARACMSASIASLSFVVARSSPVPSLALRIGSNGQCDGSQCCPSFGGCLRWHHPGWSLRLNVPQHGKTHQVLTHSKD